jgi:hypothetical protein
VIAADPDQSVGIRCRAADLTGFLDQDGAKAVLVRGNRGREAADARAKHDHVIAAVV